MELTRRFSQLLHTPATAAVLFAALSLALKENYPFSNFPMYAAPSKESSYLQVVDGDGGFLPVAELTGLTSPKVGKIYRRKFGELSRGQDQSREAQREKAGQEVLQFLRHQAQARSKSMPSHLELRRVEIRYRHGGIEEPYQVIARD